MLLRAAYVFSRKVPLHSRPWSKQTTHIFNSLGIWELPRDNNQPHPARLIRWEVCVKDSLGPVGGHFWAESLEGSGVVRGCGCHGWQSKRRNALWSRPCTAAPASWSLCCRPCLGAGQCREKGLLLWSTLLFLDPPPRLISLAVLGSPAPITTDKGYCSSPFPVFALCVSPPAFLRY